MTAPRYAGLAIQSVVPGSRYSPVLVRGDTAFTCAAEGVVTASLISTGRVVWSTRLRPAGGAWYTSGSVLTRDLVVVGLGRMVVAMRRSDGAEVWRFDEPASELTPDYGLATDSNVVAFSERRGLAIVLSATTGSVVWRRQLLPDDAKSFIRAPVISNGTLVYLRVRDVVNPVDGTPMAFAVRAETGDSLWTIVVDHSRGIKDWGDGMR